MFMSATVLPVEELRQKFGAAAQENVSLAPYASARIGGPADALLAVHSADELAAALAWVWANDLPYVILGGGSNVLISDRGVRGIVILNRAKEVRFESGDAPAVWCESGVTFSNLAHRCAAKGLSGLEWAATIPGTVGGAVYGNAGAFGGDMSQNLIWAEVLTRDGRKKMTVADLGYAYRSSVLKSGNETAIILSALLRLKNSSKAEVSATIESFSARRKAAQPPGASMGSMFKNPPGDYAGRLIEAAGLKGARVGGAEISSIHANFFVNHGGTQASDVRALIDLTIKTVKEKFGVDLELEVELIGDWSV